MPSTPGACSSTSSILYDQHHDDYYLGRYGKEMQQIYTDISESTTDQTVWEPLAERYCTFNTTQSVFLFLFLLKKSAPTVNLR